MTKIGEAPYAEVAVKPSTPGTGEWIVYFKSDGMYVLEDDGTEHGPFNATSVPITEDFFLGASEGWPSTTSGCAALAKTEYGTNDVDLQHFAFDGATAEYAQFGKVMPSNWDGGTITFKVLWTAPTGTPANTVEWNLEARAYANDDPVDAAWGTAVEVSDALIATDDFHYTDESGAVTVAGSPAGGQYVQFRVWRDAANDTETVDVRFLGIIIFYSVG